VCLFCGQRGVALQAVEGHQGLQEEPWMRRDRDPGPGHLATAQRPPSLFHRVLLRRPLAVLFCYHHAFLNLSIYSKRDPLTSRRSGPVLCAHPVFAGYRRFQTPLPTFSWRVYGIVFFLFKAHLSFYFESV
jgi:hypothetical protein